MVLFSTSSVPAGAGPAWTAYEAWAAKFALLLLAQVALQMNDRPAAVTAYRTRLVRRNLPAAHLSRLGCEDAAKKLKTAMQ